MAKDARIDIRIAADLLSRVDARRDVLGQSRTVFIERALEAALAGALENAPEGRAHVKASAAASPRAPYRQHGDALVFQCPVRKCEWKGSAEQGALCPAHGRPAVRVV